MGQVLHGSATTTEAIRRAIQARQESVRAAAKRYGISPTTAQKWRGRETSVDARMGPKEARSTVLGYQPPAPEILIWPGEPSGSAPSSARPAIVMRPTMH